MLPTTEETVHADTTPQPAGRPDCKWKQELERLHSRPDKMEQCGADHKLLIPNIRAELKKSAKRMGVRKYNVSNTPDGFKVHIKQICTVKLNGPRTRTIVD